MRSSVALLALVACTVSAQGISPMLHAVAQSMHQVCKVDRDSRQCEIVQDLYADQVAIEQGRAPQMRPVVPPEEKAIVRKTIAREAGVLTESSMRTVEAVVLRNYKVERGYSR
jgi:hypothetical protein